MHVVERIIERSSNGDRNGSFNRFKDWIFGIVVVAAGGVIWEQQATISAIKLDEQQKIDAINTHLAVLDLKCDHQPGTRGGPNEHP